MTLLWPSSRFRRLSVMVRPGCERNHLGDAVAEHVGQVEHPADVAHHGLGCHRAEGDDLRHRFGAVFLLDVVDDAIAPVLAEVDVEVRHRHALRIQETLEQQRVAQRVEIGDAEAVRHQRPGARSAARPDGHAVALGPVDEVRDDEKVARVSHLNDGLDLELEARDVFRPYAIAFGGVAERRLQPPLQTRARLAVQVLLQRRSIGRGKRGQIVLAQRQGQVAALRDRHAVGQRARQVGEATRHLFLRREVLLRREALRTPRIREDVALGNAHARLVRAEFFARRELHGMRGDNRQRQIGGQAHGGRGQRVVVAAAGALHLEIEAVREKAPPKRWRRRVPRSDCLAPVRGRRHRRRIRTGRSGLRFLRRTTRASIPRGRDAGWYDSRASANRRA